MSAHNTSLASLGLAVLVLSAVTWRACTRTSAEPVRPVVPHDPKSSADDASASWARTTAANVDAAATLGTCRQPGLGAATCADRPGDAAATNANLNELERLVSADPSRALASIAEADRREGNQVEPRAALEVRALVALQRIGSAHAKLQHFAEHYPASPALPALVQLTGYHPRPPLRAPTR